MTLPHAPVNLPERQGNIINSLEHAHIYIAQLHHKLESQDAANIAAQNALQKELDALKALIIGR